MIVLPEVQTRKRDPDLVVALLGAIQKEEPGGVIKARVLLDRTNGLTVNERTRVRDQVRASFPDFKRSMRHYRQRGASSSTGASLRRALTGKPSSGSNVFMKTVATIGVLGV